MLRVHHRLLRLPVRALFLLEMRLLVLKAKVRTLGVVTVVARPLDETTGGRYWKEFQQTSGNRWVDTPLGLVW